MKKINVEGVGLVDFPDEMSDEDISKALSGISQDSGEAMQKGPPKGWIDAQVPQALMQSPGEAYEMQRGKEQRKNVAMADAGDFGPMTEFTPPTEPKQTYGQILTDPTLKLPRFPSVDKEPTDPIEQALTLANIPPFQLASQFIPPNVRAQVLRSGLNQILGIGEFVSSPLGTLTAVAGEGAAIGALAKGVGTAITGGFTADMVRGTLEQIGVTTEQWDKMNQTEKIDALTNIAGSATMTALLGVHATAPARRRAKIEQLIQRIDDARQKQKTAEVHGDVRSQQPPTGKVPEQGGGAGVQSQTQTVAQEAQVSLTPEQHAEELRKITQDVPGGAKVDPRSITLTEFDAENSGPGAIMMIQDTYGVTEAEAQEILTRSRETHGIKEGEEDAPLPAGIVENASGTFTATYEEGGYVKEVRTKTRQEAEAWMEGKKAATKKRAEAQAAGQAAAPGQEEMDLGVVAQKVKSKPVPSKVKKATLTVRDEDDPQIDIPFGRGGIATGRNGVIVLNKRAYLKWYRRMPERLRDAAVDRLVDEETIHAYTSDMDALEYFSHMTTAEKMLVSRVYVGPHGGWQKRGITALDIGHEAIRQRIQSLSDMSIREAYDSGMWERGLSRFYNALNNAIAHIRAKFGTTASKRQLRILDTVQRNMTEMSRLATPEGEQGTGAQVPPATTARPEQLTRGLQAALDRITKGSRSPQAREKKPFRSEDLETLNAINSVTHQIRNSGKALIENTDITEATMHGVVEDIENGVPKSQVMERIAGIEMADHWRDLFGALYDAIKETHEITSRPEMQALSELFPGMTTGEGRGQPGDKRIGPGLGPQAISKDYRPGESHETDLELARQLPTMTTAQMRQMGEEGFNRYNLRLFRNATPDQLSELQLNQAEFMERLQDAGKKYAADPSEANMDEWATLGVMSQFYSEGFREAQLHKAGQALGATQNEYPKEITGSNGTVIGPGPFAIIKAYHGSASEFEKFNLEKIGTGQGATTYGWGLYFAEEPEVARTYGAPNELAGLSAPMLNVNNRLEMRPQNAGQDWHAKVYVANFGYQGALEEIEIQIEYQRRLTTLPPGQTMEGRVNLIPMYESLAAEVSKLKGQNIQPVFKSGYEYEVELSLEPHEVLDLDDRPTAEQMRRINDAMRKAKLQRFSFVPNSNHELISLLEDRIGTQSGAADLLWRSGFRAFKYLDQFSRELRAMYEISNLGQEDTGKFYVNEYPHAFYGASRAVTALLPKDEAIAEMNRLQDIARSRGTSNYVVFDEDRIRLLNRNGERINPSKIDPPDQYQLPLARDKRNKNANQPEFFLTATPLVGQQQKPERPTAAESGALPKVEGEEKLGKMAKQTRAELEGRLPALAAGSGEIITPNDVDAIASHYLDNSPIEEDYRPSFDEFAKWARRRIRFPRNALIGVWENAVWRHLVHAPGETLMNWVKALDLENKLGKPPKGVETAPVRNIASVFDEAQAAEEGQAKLRDEAFAKIRRLEEKAGKLEQESETLKLRRPKTYPDEFARLEAEAEIEGKASQAKKIRSEVRDTQKMLREGVTLRPKKSVVPAPETPALLPEGVAEPETAKPVKGRSEQEERAQAAQRYRAKAISTMAQKLIRESVPDADLHPKEIFLEDIDFRADVSELPYHLFSAQDMRSPRTIQSVFREGARTSGKNVSVTKRLAVLLDEKNGKVFLVSAYPEGHSGIRVMDPYGSEHVLLKDYLERYKPIASILLKDPVKDFKHIYKDMAEYNAKLGEEAQGRMGHEAYQEFAGERALLEQVPEVPPDIEGTEGVESSAAGAGPGGKEMRALMGEGKGTVEASRRTPVTAGEIGATFDYLIDEMGGDITEENFRKAIVDLGFRAKELRRRGARTTRKGTLTGEELYQQTVPGRPLTGTHRNLVSAVSKIAKNLYHEFRKADVPISEDESYDAALSQIYNHLAEGEFLPGEQGRELFTKALLGKFGERTPAASEVQRARRRLEGRLLPPQAESGARELELAGPPKRGPLKPSDIQKYKPKPLSSSNVLRGTPEPIPGNPDKLTAENAEFVAKEAAKRFWFDENPRKPTGPYQPTVPKVTPDDPGEEAIRVFSFRPKEVPDNPAPQAIMKAIDRTTELTGIGIDSIKAFFLRRETDDIITAWRDRADTKAVIRGREWGNAVRSHTKDEMSLAAAKVVIASGGDHKVARSFLVRITNGEAKARELLKSDSVVKQAVARQWLEAADQLRKEVNHFLSNPKDEGMWNAAKETGNAFREQYKFEISNGIDLKWLPDYMPGRYEGDIFNDRAVFFWENRILGRNFTKPKMFPSYYHAIEAGPFIPRSYNIAELVDSRVRQGAQRVNLDLYLQSLKNVMDPATGEIDPKTGKPDPNTQAPVAMSGVREQVAHKAIPELNKPETITLGRYISPGPEYIPLSLGTNHVPIYIRRGFYPLVEALTLRQGRLSKSPQGRAALQLTGALKHGAILILDTFHPARLGQYYAAATGFDTKAWGAWTALDFRDQDLDRAVKAGMISAKQAQWSREQVNIKLPNGIDAKFTRKQVLDMLIDHGLNVGRIQDALYRNWVDKLDVKVNGKKYGISAMNRLVFDKVTRGLMASTAVESFEHYNNKHPEMSMNKLMRDVVKDTNLYYGSLGRQGFFKDPTFQEISQLLFLAPQWVEGLIQKEVRFASRLTRKGLNLASGGRIPTGREGLPEMGTLGKAVGRGLVGYVALTQMINLATRGQLTFKNKEEGHMLDAWIPTPWNGKGTGFWLSPLSVFAEVLHDVKRLRENKPTDWHVIRQIGENKLGPWGRLLVGIITAGESPYGERPQTNLGVGLSILGQVTPAPISLGKSFRAIGHAIAPGQVSPNPPGVLERQMAASLTGTKLEPGRSYAQKVSQRAHEFMTENGFEYRPYVLSPTEDASYDKIRTALRSGDEAGALKLLRRMQQVRTDRQITTSFRRWAHAPLSGNRRLEQMFVASLDDAGLDDYSNAVRERIEAYQKFIELYAKNPREAKAQPGTR